MEWTNDHETILESIRENSLINKKLYTKLYLNHKSKLANYKIPIIIFSALNSVFSVGAERYLPQHYISGISCLISLTVGIIGSLQMYLQIEQNMEICLVASRDYYNLAIDIYKTLSLERSHRGQAGKECLDETYSRYASITDKALLVRKKQIDALFSTPNLPDNDCLRLTIVAPGLESSGEGTP